MRQIKGRPSDGSEQPFEGVSLTAAQAERLLSICVDMIDLCAEVTGKIAPAVGTVVAYACEDVLNGILATKSRVPLSGFHDRKHPPEGSEM